MKSILSPRWLYWSAIQVVVLIVCDRGKVSSAEIEQGCVGSRLRLECPEMKVINVSSVVLGDSECWATLISCCIKDNDCTHVANEQHTTEVHRGCDGKRICTVEALKEKIPCGFGNSWSNNDFERITYNCIDDPGTSIAATTSGPEVTEYSSHAGENSTEDETANDGTTNSTDERDYDGDDHEPDEEDNETKIQIHTNTEETGKDGQSGNQFVLPAVMATICLLVLVAIVVVVVIIRRKRRTQVKCAVEMTDVGNNVRNEAINENDNQKTSLNHGNGAPFPTHNRDTASKTKKSDNKAKPSEPSKAWGTYETPNDVVYSVAGDAGSPTADSTVYCNVDSKEPAYQVPTAQPEVYSVLRNVEDPEQSGSTADASNNAGNVYCDVETREPVNVANSAAENAYDELFGCKESEYKVVTAAETNPVQKKVSPSHTKAPDSYSKVNKQSKNAAAFGSKADFHGKADAKGEANTSDGFPSPTYEAMSPAIPEGIYANEPALSPTRSLAASTLSRKGSDTENPYCEMQSPSVKFKDDGGQTIIENDLYNH